MAIRRKLKRIILVLFLMTLVTKIYTDYTVINRVNENGLQSVNYIMNDSSQIRLISLYNIKDILTDNNLPFFQRKMAVISVDRTADTKIKISNVTRDSKKLKENSKEEIVQVESNLVNDSRIHYDPSFKNKMEEASRQKVDNSKVVATEDKFPNEVNNKLNSIEIRNETAKAEVKIPKSREVPEKPKRNQQISISRDKPPFKNPPNAKSKKNPKVYKVSHVVASSEISLNDTEISRIRKKISRMNEEQLMNNKDVFGPLRPNETVILIQVHNRLANLKYLVESLRLSKHIEETLVIFSHDFWDQNINDFVASITEFRVMQIFFPYSFQLNPLRFPGRDPRDCLWNHGELSRKIGRGNLTGCLNSKWPDSYGHYREASFTQIKHHWWWKLVQVFDHVTVMKNFTGNVIFLEEDHYVLPDFLHMLRLLQKVRDASFRMQNVYALGNYLRQTASSATLVERGDWVVNKYNLGFAFSRSAYDLIKKCQNSFCEYDDYNWDWTLAMVSKTCANKRFSMLSLKLSRVLHIGSCGTHMKKEVCSVDKEVALVRTRIRSLENNLFPTSLKIHKNYKGSVKPKKSNGGWGDYRDKQFCASISNGTNIDSVLEKLQYKHVSRGQTAY